MKWHLLWGSYVITYETKEMKHDLAKLTVLALEDQRNEI